MHKGTWIQVAGIATGVTLGFALGVVSLLTFGRNRGDGCPVAESMIAYKTPGEETGAVFECDYSFVVALKGETYLVSYPFEKVAVLSGSDPSDQKLFRPGGRKVVPEGGEPGYSHYKSNLRVTSKGFEFTSFNGGVVHLDWVKP